MIEAVILYHSMCSLGVYRAVGNPSDGDASGAGPESSRGPQPPTQIVIREEIRKEDVCTRTGTRKCKIKIKLTISLF